MKNKYCIVFVSIPRGLPAKKMAHDILRKRLAACVNIVPNMTSHYWWKGKMETTGECLLIIKTISSHVPVLMRFIRGKHPYDVPEIIVVPIAKGFKPYLRWISKETSAK